MPAQRVAGAVVGALSPVAALSTIMLLGSGQPAADTVACLAGWTIVVGLMLLCVALA